MERLVIAILAIGAGVLATCSLCPAREPYLGNLEVKIRCHPPLVYRGDDFVVQFGSPHDDFDFGVSPAGGSLILLSFPPGKRDRIAPVIPPEKFAAMQQITLNTATARGSLSNWWRGFEVPRALKAPEPIFTDSGSYEILLGLGLGSEDAEYGACWVDYIDKQKQPGAPLEVEALYDVIRNTYRHSCSARTYEGAITCPPTAIHRGERLAIDLQSENPADKIGILDPEWNVFLLPTEKHPGPNRARSLPGIRIVAGSETARAYSWETPAAYAEPSVHIETKSGPVFSKSGWYIAIPVPGPRCDIVTDVGACWIHYMDTPR
jgi:hypothetical protein